MLKDVEEIEVEESNLDSRDDDYMNHSSTRDSVAFDLARVRFFPC